MTKIKSIYKSKQNSQVLKQSPKALGWKTVLNKDLFETFKKKAYIT